MSHHNVSKCVWCKHPHHSIAGEFFTARNGRRMFRFTCPETHRKATAIVGGTTAPKAAKGKGGKAAEKAAEHAADDAKRAAQAAQHAADDAKRAAREAEAAPAAKPRKRRTHTREDTVASGSTKIDVKAVVETDIDEAQGWDILRGMFEVLQAEGWEAPTSNTILRQADAVQDRITGGKPTPTAQSRRVELGRDLARLMRTYMAANRIRPVDFRSLYPRDLLAAFVADPTAWEIAPGSAVPTGRREALPGGGAPAVPTAPTGPSGGVPSVDELLPGEPQASLPYDGADRVVAVDGVPVQGGSTPGPDTQIGRAVSGAVTRGGTAMAGAAAGAEIGSLAGPWGAVIGGAAGTVLGAFFPEVVDGLENLTPAQ